ncbi:MAG: OmcA/MtrC family decaheme c-type cytochrome [Bryobacteraceae bacterium]|nr:OmcA/MtrC family decaheme c-type cytochrome [Bryobacteraceae bacterium]
MAIQITNVQYTIGNPLVVTYKLTDPQGALLDQTGVLTPGAISVRYILSYIPASTPGGQYIPITTTKNSTAPGLTVTQPGTDSGGTLVSNPDGTYVYTFKTVAPISIPSGSTLTLGMTASRDLTSFDLGTDYANATSSFTVGGGTPTVREVVTTATCNKCHSQIAFHGGSRRSMEICVLCHTAGYINPQTGNSIDMKVMFHKIHMGENLPSVKAGTPYQINGSHGNNDYSDIAFPANPNTCQACHAPDAKQATAFSTVPTAAACGSCHDDVNFATGVNHLGGPQFDDNQCANCHQPQGETDFDASVIGAHVNPDQSSLLPGIQGTILSVTNTSPGQKPVVAFTVKDKTGAMIPMSAFSQKNYRLAFVLAGPTSDYVGINAHGYVSEDPTKTSVLNGSTYTYTFSQAIPAGATGTYTIGMEGRRYDTVLAGTTKAQTIEYGMKNVVFNFSVDGSAVVPRRAVVSLAKCDGCHWNLQLHGENRNQIEQCVLCHNPVENDSSYRPASANPPESIDFALMIHRIHSGPSQTRDFTIWGFGNSKNNFNNVLYPGDLTNCEQCHLPGTYVMPIGATAQINDTRGFISPVHPTTGACLGCHATVDAASHALVNTSSLGESCSVCHGPNGDYSVAKVHASN